MIIKRVLTNNAVIVEYNKIDKIICGKGIGFSKKKGEKIDKSLISQIFVLKSDDNNIEEIIQDIPLECFEISKKILEILNKEKIFNKYNDSLKLTLADHIFAIVKRYQENIKPLKNALLWDLKHFYEKEFEIANEAAKLIYQYFKIKINDDEKGFIVLHLLNSQSKSEKQLELINKIIKEIQQVIRLNLKLQYKR